MDVRRIYGRLDDWARGLSRARYAALVGSSGAIALLALTAVVGESRPVDAAAMGATMSVVYYAFDPNH